MSIKPQSFDAPIGGRSIFISFPSKDRKVAERICDALEARGYSCWISCRHIGPGENFQEAIVRAVRAAKAMVLVFTQATNNSDEIKKELALAGQNKLVVIPVRVEDVTPNDAFTYEFSTRQWIDAFDDWEGSIARLAAQLSGPVGIKPADRGGTVAAPHREPTASNLPRQMTALIGRDAELSEVKQRVEASALVTIVGSGGAGKTRLALAVGAELLDRFADGVWLLELAPATNPSAVAEQLSGLLGAPPSDDRSPLDTAAIFLRRKRLLLILDNCEHLISGVAEVADTLLKRCPDVRILATSREGLGVPGEVIYRIPSLAVPPRTKGISASEALHYGAVQLFVERAATALGTYSLLETDASAVAAICQRLDGIALAIELAAARMKILKPELLLEKLIDRFRVLTGGARTALPRQQTLRALIDWSYGLLPEEERILLQRLSVFAAGWSLEGAVSVAAGEPLDEWSVVDHLSALVDKSLVVADLSGTEPRYRFLESTREYASEKLCEVDEPERRRRLAEYLVDFYGRAHSTASTALVGEWLRTYLPEIDNLSAAVEWAFGPKGSPALGVALVVRAIQIFAHESRNSEIERWVPIALGHVDSNTPTSDLVALRLRNLYYRNATDRPSLLAEARKTVAIARETGDPILMARALTTLGTILGSHEEQLPEARSHTNDAIKILRSVGPNRRLGWVLSESAWGYARIGDSASARRDLDEAIAIARQFEDPSLLEQCLMYQAEFAHRDGETNRAIESVEEILSAARSSGRLRQPFLFANLAGYLLATVRIEEARSAIQEAVNAADPEGDYLIAVVALEHWALASALEGRMEQAARMLGFTDGSHCRLVLGRRDFTEACSYERLKNILAQNLSQFRIDELMANGARWSLQEALSRAALV